MAYKNKIKTATVETEPVAPIEPIEEPKTEEKIEQTSFLPNDYKILHVKTRCALGVRPQPTYDSNTVAILPPETIESVVKVETIEGVKWGQLESEVGWINLSWVDEI